MLLLFPWLNYFVLVLFIMVHGFFSTLLLNIYFSVNYCDSNCWCFFLLLMVVAKSKGNILLHLDNFFFYLVKQAKCKFHIFIISLIVKHLLTKQLFCIRLIRVYVSCTYKTVHFYRQILN